MSRELLFSVTAADMRWDYYNGSGNGGQNRNKRENCVRCTHEPSGAVGKSEDERSQAQNKQLAFRRCVESKKFRDWTKLEAARRQGVLEQVEQEVDRQMRQIRVEIKDPDLGKWKEVNKEQELSSDE